MIYHIVSKIRYIRYVIYFQKFVLIMIHVQDDYKLIKNVCNESNFRMIWFLLVTMELRLPFVFFNELFWNNMMAYFQLLNLEIHGAPLFKYLLSWFKTVFWFLIKSLFTLSNKEMDVNNALSCLIRILLLFDIRQRWLDHFLLHLIDWFIIKYNWLYPNKSPHFFNQKLKLLKYKYKTLTLTLWLPHSGTDAHLRQWKKSRIQILCILGLF